MKTITRLLTTLFAAFALVFAVGCEETADGIGEDLEDMGDEAEDATD